MFQRGWLASLVMTSTVGSLPNHILEEARTLARKSAECLYSSTGTNERYTFASETCSHLQNMEIVLAKDPGPHAVLAATLTVQVVSIRLYQGLVCDASFETSGRNVATRLEALLENLQIVKRDLRKSADPEKVPIETRFAFLTNEVGSIMGQTVGTMELLEKRAGAIGARFLEEVRSRQAQVRDSISMTEYLSRFEPFSYRAITVLNELIKGSKHRPDLRLLKKLKSVWNEFHEDVCFLLQLHTGGCSAPTAEPQQVLEPAKVKLTKNQFRALHKQKRTRNAQGQPSHEEDGPSQATMELPVEVMSTIVTVSTPPRESVVTLSAEDLTGFVEVSGRKHRTPKPVVVNLKHESRPVTTSRPNPDPDFNANDFPLIDTRTTELTDTTESLDAPFEIITVAVPTNAEKEKISDAGLTFGDVDMSSLSFETDVSERTSTPKPQKSRPYRHHGQRWRRSQGPPLLPHPPVGAMMYVPVRPVSEGLTSQLSMLASSAAQTIAELSQVCDHLAMIPLSDKMVTETLKTKKEILCASHYVSALKHRVDGMLETTKQTPSLFVPVFKQQPHEGLR